MRIARRVRRGGRGDPPGAIPAGRLGPTQLTDNAELAQDKGNDLRALIRSLNRPAKPTDVLRNGPIPAADIANFAGVYERGRREILTWMIAAARSQHLRRQLPTP